MTSEEIEAAKDQLIADALADEGVTSLNDGTRSVTKDALRFKRNMELLNSLSASADRPQFGMRFTQLIPPGSG